MRIHTPETIQSLKFLRKSGKSIPEIMMTTGLSKTTIWHHVHSIEISSEDKIRINSNRGGSRKRYQASYKHAENDVKKLLTSENREICMLIGMLYWAEGSKRELVFTNTNLDMIKIYLFFLKKVLMVPESDIHLLIRTAIPIKPKEAQNFWINQTGMLPSQVSTNHDNKQNKTKSRYGICRVNVRKNSYYLKQIQCIIDAVKAQYAPIV